MNVPAPGLLTDLYQLTMAQAYFELGMQETAVFELFVRRLPPTRGFLLAAGECGFETLSVPFCRDSADTFAAQHVGDRGAECGGFRLQRCAVWAVSERAVNRLPFARFGFLNVEPDAALTHVF